MKDIIRMNQLAGLITEGQAKKMMKVLNENEEDTLVKENTPVSKDKKIEVIKEWIWYTCNEGQAKEDIDQYNKMVDDYFADKTDVTKKDFQNIWSKVTEDWGVGDIGADWEAFPETWRDVQKGNLMGTY